LFGKKAMVDNITMQSGTSSTASMTDYYNDSKKDQTEWDKQTIHTQTHIHKLKLI
jgi:hypothetical protein